MGGSGNVIESGENDQNGNGDNNDANTVSSDGLIADLFNGDSYFIIIMTAIALLIICCCLTIFAFFALRKYERNKKNKQKHHTITPPVIQMDKVKSMSATSMDMMGILTNAESPRMSGVTPTLG